MSDSPDPAWALAGVALGGVIGGFAQVVSSWLQSKRDDKRARRDRRATHLYALQDQIMVVEEMTRKIVKDLNDPLMQTTAALFWDNTNLKNEISKMKHFSVRVGDEPLGLCLGKAMKAFYDASKPKADHRKKLEEASEHLKSVSMRIGVLLHTDTETDFGFGAPPKWFQFRRQSAYKKRLAEANGQPPPESPP